MDAKRQRQRLRLPPSPVADHHRNATSLLILPAEIYIQLLVSVPDFATLHSLLLTHPRIYHTFRLNESYICNILARSLFSYEARRFLALLRPGSMTFSQWRILLKLLGEVPFVSRADEELSYDRNSLDGDLHTFRLVELHRLACIQKEFVTPAIEAFTRVQRSKSGLLWLLNTKLLDTYIGPGMLPKFTGKASKAELARVERTIWNLLYFTKIIHPLRRDPNSTDGLPIALEVNGRNLISDDEPGWVWDEHLRKFDAKELVESCSLQEHIEMFSLSRLFDTDHIAGNERSINGTNLGWNGFDWLTLSNTYYGDKLGIFLQCRLASRRRIRLEAFELPTHAEFMKYALTDGVSTDDDLIKFVAGYFRKLEEKKEKIMAWMDMVVDFSLFDSHSDFVNELIRISGREVWGFRGGFAERFITKGAGILAVRRSYPRDERYDVGEACKPDQQDAVIVEGEFDLMSEVDEESDYWDDEDPETDSEDGNDDSRGSGSEDWFDEEEGVVGFENDVYCGAESLDPLAEDNVQIYFEYSTGLEVETENSHEYLDDGSEFDSDQDYFPSDIDVDSDEGDSEIGQLRDELDELAVEARIWLGSGCEGDAVNIVIGEGGFPNEAEVIYNSLLGLADELTESEVDSDDELELEEEIEEMRQAFNTASGESNVELEVREVWMCD